MRKKTNNILSKETAVALRAEIKKYSDTFKVDETQKYIKEVVSEIGNDILKKWLNENMDKVVKEAIKEELSNIVQKELRKK